MSEDQEKDEEKKTFFSEGMEIQNSFLATYIIKQHLSSGGFSDIYSCTKKDGEKPLAIKVCKHDDLKSMNSMKNEIKNFFFLNEKNEKLLFNLRRHGIPLLHDVVFQEGKSDEQPPRVMEVFDLLGPNLHEVYKSLNYKFSLKTIQMIAVQCLECISFLHYNGMIHCDIQPCNFCIGGKNYKKIFIVDLGLSRTLQKGERDISLEYLSGSLLFMSHINMKKQVISFLDDLEGLGYMLLYFLEGDVTWREDVKKIDVSMKEKEDLLVEENFKKVVEKKEKIMVYLKNKLKEIKEDDFEKKKIYEKLISYFEAIRKINIKKEPIDYEFLKNIFLNFGKKNENETGFQYDFDWVGFDFTKSKDVEALKSPEELDTSSVLFGHVDFLLLPLKEAFKFEVYKSRIIDIRVKTVTKILKISIDDTKTIRNLKERIHQKQFVSWEMFELLLRGKGLDDNLAIKDSPLINDSLVFVTLKPSKKRK